MTRRAGLAAVAAGALLWTTGAATGATGGGVLRVTIDPAAPRFGETFRYVVELELPADAESDALSLVAPAGPFTPLGPSRTRRSSADGVVRVTVLQELACLSAECVPREGTRAVTLPVARAHLDGPELVAPPATVRVRPRVSPAAVAAAQPVFREPSGLPEPSTRVDSSLLTVALVLGGAALAALALGLLAVGARRDAGRARRADPVLRAIRLLRESAGRSSDDRRRAAALASRVVPLTDVARDAERVAWERRAPLSADTTTLAERAAARGGEGS